mgnify:CR=1 FL=1
MLIPEITKRRENTRRKCTGEAISMTGQTSAQHNRKHADGAVNSIILQECAKTKWKNMIKGKNEDGAFVIHCAG